MEDCFSTLGGPKWRRVLETMSAGLELPLALLDSKTDRLLCMSPATTNLCLGTMNYDVDICRLCRERIVRQGWYQFTGKPKCFHCYCGFTYLVSGIRIGHDEYFTMAAGAFYMQPGDRKTTSNLVINMSDEFKRLCTGVPTLTQAMVEAKCKCLEQIRNLLACLVEDVVQGDAVIWPEKLFDSLLELSPQDPEGLIFDAITEVILSLPEFDAGIAIGTVNSHDDSIKMVHGKGEIPAELVESTGIGPWVLKEGQPLIIKDIARDPRLPWRIKAQVQLVAIKQLICLPIITGGNTSNLLYIGSKHNEEFQPMVYKYMENIVRMAALLLEADQSRRHLAKVRCQIRAYHETIRIINSDLDLVTVLELVGDLITSLFDVPTLNLHIKKDQSREEAIRVNRVMGGQELKPKDRDQVINHHKNNCFSVRFPIEAKGKNVGNFRARACSALDGQDLEFLKGLCDLVGVAVFGHSLRREMQNNVKGIIQALMRAMELHDPYTRGHLERVGSYAVAVAEQLNLDEEMMGRLKWAGYLHDVGKIMVPEKILSKCSKVSEEEMELIRPHPVFGAQIIAVIPELCPLTPAIRYHHERLDGTGYPEGLSGEQIPFEAQLLAVVDVYDALTSRRAYRDAYSPYEAFRILRQQAEHQLNQRVVEALNKVVRNTLFLAGSGAIEAVHESTNDATEKEMVPQGSLTKREIEVLGLVAKGLRNKEIATSLYISEKTVKTHISNILRKLNVPDRTRAVVLALEKGFLKITP